MTDSPIQNFIGPSRESYSFEDLKALFKFSKLIYRSLKVLF
jgi:hypothetical protein